MGWLARLGFLAAGLYMLVMASNQLAAGKFVFDNASYHQTTFAAGGMGIGVFLMLLAFLPKSDWVYRHITTRKQKKLGRKAQERRSISN